MHESLVHIILSYLSFLLYIMADFFLCTALFVCVCVCNNVSLITASVAVIALRYKHHQSPEEVTLFITALFVRLLKRLHRAAESSEALFER